MNKSELRKMVREEIKTELYKILPQLLKETIGSIMAKEVKRAKRRAAKPGALREGVRTGKTAQPMDRKKLAALIGYGDMRPGARGEVVIDGDATQMIAGVPMQGGLLAKETEMGVAHMRDYNVNPIAAPADPPVMAGEVGEAEEAYEPQFANLPPQPGGVDGGADVPMAVVAALGKRSADVLKETNFKAHWRPGMKRPE
jgi:hypothetical protein